jgi:hypothetical protein
MIYNLIKKYCCLCYEPLFTVISDDVLQAVPEKESGADHVQGVPAVPRGTAASVSKTERKIGRSRSRWAFVYIGFD